MIPLPTRLKQLIVHGCCAISLSLPALALAYDYPWNGGKEDVTSPTPPPETDCPSGNCGGPSCHNTGSPVYLATGALVWRDTDIRFPTQTRIQLKRTYNSFDHRAGLFGRGWVSEQEVNIARTYKALTQGNADHTPKTATEFKSVPIWLAEYGRRYTLEETSSGCTTPAVLQFTFQKQADGRFKQVYEDSQQFSIYSATGQLLESYDDKTGTRVYYEYDDDHRLIRQFDSDGVTLHFTYNDQGFVRAVRDQGNRIWRYRYNDTGTLSQVTHPDGDTRDYRYQTVDGISYKQYLLTDIKNNANELVLSVTWENQTIDPSFDSAMRVASYVGSDGHQHEYTYKNTQVDERPVVKVTKKTFQIDSESTIKTQTFYVDPETYRIHQRYSNAAKIGTTDVAFDERGNVVEKKDKRGNVTRHEYNAQGQRIKTTYLADTDNAKVMTLSYWKKSDRIASVNEYGLRENRYVYDEHLRLIKETQIDLATQKQRVTTYRYHNNTQDSQGNLMLGKLASIDGPLAGKDDMVEFQYNAQRQLISTKNALGHERLLSYNALGQVISQTDPNGVVTEFDYNSRNQLIAQSRQGRKTQYQYNAQGQRTAIIDPLGRQTRFRYNEHNKLQKIVYPSGDCLSYGYDYHDQYTEITQRYYQDCSDLIRTQVSQYTPNSLLPIKNFLSDNSNESYVNSYRYSDHEEVVMYYYQGEFIGHPVQALVQYYYDQEGQLIRINNSNSYNKVTEFVYDVLNRLTQVTDPNGAVTAYRYNAWDELVRLTSPDTGKTDYKRDTRGNIITATNANKQTTAYRYDVNNRLTGIFYHGDQLKTFLDYDQGEYGKGRLTQVKENNGQIDYRYDDRGLLTQATHNIMKTDYSVAYGYNAGSALTQVTYPSGMSLSLEYDNAGRMSRLEMIQAGQKSTLMDQIRWHGTALKRYRQGNGIATEFNYDSAGRLIKKQIGDRAGFQYRLDNQSNIQEQTLEQTGSKRLHRYGYNKLMRLKQERLNNEESLLDTWLYKHDSVGNRISQQTGNTQTLYGYEENSNRLNRISAHTIETDAAGNIVNDGIRQYHYNVKNRVERVTHLESGLEAHYSYNVFNQRIRKQVGSEDIRYVYGVMGELLGEYHANGQVITEYLYHYAYGTPELIASIGQSGIHYVHTDHLATPRLLSNTNGDIVWDWISDAFGNTQPNEDSDGDGTLITFNPRFPGQYYDAESGLHYNWHRYYDPSLGRYITSDPIGLNGGLNTYGYVSGNPVNAIDPMGLYETTVQAWCRQNPVACAQLGFDALGAGVGAAASLPDTSDEDCSPQSISTTSSEGGGDDGCRKASKSELKKHGIDGHAYKIELVGPNNISQYDICFCRNGRIVLKAVGKCGKNGPSIDTWDTWK